MPCTMLWKAECGVDTISCMMMLITNPRTHHTYIRHALIYMHHHSVLVTSIWVAISPSLCRHHCAAITVPPSLCRHYCAAAITADSASEKQQATPAIPELGGGFLALMSRMCKEKYVQAIKSIQSVSGGSSAGGEQDQVIEYRFGPRYFAEFGRQQIVLSYFDSLGQPIDASALEEAATEEQEVYAVEGGGAADADADADAEEEEEGAGDGDGADAEADGPARRRQLQDLEVVPLGRKRARK